MPPSAASAAADDARVEAVDATPAAPPCSRTGAGRSVAGRWRGREGVSEDSATANTYLRTLEQAPAAADGGRQAAEGGPGKTSQ